MKTRSFQHSLLQEILALDQNSLPSFTSSHITKSHSNSNICSSQPTYPLKTISLSKPLNHSIDTSKQDIQCIDTELNNNMQIKYHFHTQEVTNTKTIIKTTQIKTQISQQKSQPISYSTIYTHRNPQENTLYDKSLKEQNAKKLWIIQQQKYKQQQQLKPCSYKPTINKTSIQIMNKITKQQLQQKRKKKKQQSIKRILQQQQQKAMKGCNFTPNITKNPQQKMQSHHINNLTHQSNNKNHIKNNPSIFNQLYQDSKIRQSKNQQIQSKYYRQLIRYPIIDQISKQITKFTNFQDRRLKDQKKRLKKQILNKQKQNIEKSKHRPSINHSSYHRPKQIPIGQHLYQISKKNKNIQNPTLDITNKTHTQTNKKSIKVYEQRKALVFSQIFKMLDEDQDGLISINSISLLTLPHQVVKIIYPLIQQLQLMEVQLKEQQFTTSLSNLFKTLSIHQKDILLGFVVTTRKQQQLQYYKPKINPKSKYITNCNQRSKMSIYDYCYIKQQQKQKQLQTQRIQKSKRQLQKCTFKPKILSRKY